VSDELVDLAYQTMQATSTFDGMRPTVEFIAVEVLKLFANLPVHEMNVILGFENDRKS
jgi:hypothetical protein